MGLSADGFFDVVSRLDGKWFPKTEIFDHGQRPMPELAKLPSIESPENTTFLIGTGGQLGRRFNLVMHPISESILLFLGPGRQHVDYERTRRVRYVEEIRRVFVDFLLAFPDNPAFVWSYAVCVTDNLIFNLMSFQPIVRDISYPSYDPQGVIPIWYKFNNTSLVLNAKHICWRRPGDWHDESFIIQKTCRDESFLRGQLTRVGLYRERIGVVPRSRINDDRLALNIFPNQEDLRYAVWRADSGGLRISKADEAVEIGRRLEQFGVLDVCPLKLWRLWKDDLDLVYFDELTLGFQRVTGRMVYVNASTGLFPFRTESEFAETDMGTWLKSRVAGKGYRT